MLEFPFAIEIGDYFEKTYFGRVLPNHTLRIPLFPIRIWNQYTRANLQWLEQITTLKGCIMGSKQGAPHFYKNVALFTT